MDNDSYNPNQYLEYLYGLLEKDTHTSKEEILQLIEEEKKAQRLYQKEMQHLEWIDKKQQRELGKLRKHTETVQSLRIGLTAEVKKLTDKSFK